MESSKGPIFVNDNELNQILVDA